MEIYGGKLLSAKQKGLLNMRVSYTCYSTCIVAVASTCIVIAKGVIVYSQQNGSDTSEISYGEFGENWFSFNYFVSCFDHFVIVVPSGSQNISSS